MEIEQGDLVMSVSGQRGIVAYICDCDQCQERGYLEPRIQWEDGSGDYISQYDSEHGYPEFYRIGENVFNYNVQTSKLLGFIEDKQKDLRKTLKDLEDATGLLRKTMK